jgi:molecular chaperone GrpE
MEEKKKDKGHEPGIEKETGETNMELMDEQDDEKSEKTSRPKHKKEDKVEKLEKEVAELNDKYVRLYSEFDNFRRRTLKEKIELSKTASAEIIETLLPVLDDLERAYNAIDPIEGTHSAMKDGVGLILNKFLMTLTAAGLEPIKALGEPFDTDFHEAITNIPAPSEEMKGKVVDVIMKGYMLGGKVLRFAKVVVGT